MRNALYVEIEGLYCQRAMRRASLAELDALFAALQYRGFRGE